MDFVAAINHIHPDYLQAAQLLREHLGFLEIARDEVSVTVNNGVLSIRCRYGTQPGAIHIDMESQDMAAFMEELTRLGFEKDGEPTVPTIHRHEQLMIGPFGLQVCVYHMLTDDDLNIPMDLQESLDWEPEVKKLAQLLLKNVLLTFRERARSKMVAQAEALAMIEGEVTVTMKDMVAAFLYTTPDFKQADLRRLLVMNGISEEFIAEQLSRSDINI